MAAGLTSISTSVRHEYSVFEDAGCRRRGCEARITYADFPTDGLNVVHNGDVFHVQWGFNGINEPIVDRLREQHAAADRVKHLQPVTSTEAHNYCA